jgi:5-methylcytosine-specific restriction endonuclease McrA
MLSDPAEMIRDALLYIAGGRTTQACALVEELGQLQIPVREKVARSPRGSSAQLDSPRRLSPPSLQVRATIFGRDKYICRYCGRKTALEASFIYLNGHFPKLVPIHPNWRTGFVHPILPVITTSLDHIQPLARHGDNSEDNLATTCSECNYTKSASTPAEMGWTVRTIPDSDWDGASGALLRAMEASPVEHPQIMQWIPVLQRG